MTTLDLRKPLLPAPPASQASAPPEATPPAEDMLRTIVGTANPRHLSPRQIADISQDLYLAGFLSFEEHALLAFQAELHPDYERTIGALTGEPAQPDRPRDYLAIWEERLAFEHRYNADRPDLIDRTRHIAEVLRALGAPAGYLA